VGVVESVVSEDEAVSVEDGRAVSAAVERPHQRLHSQVLPLDVRHQIAVGVKVNLTRTAPEK